MNYNTLVFWLLLGVASIITVVGIVDLIGVGLEYIFKVDNFCEWKPVGDSVCSYQVDKRQIVNGLKMIIGGGLSTGILLSLRRKLFDA